MGNPDVSYTLRQAVDEVLLLLTGLTLEYNPDSERLHAVARCLNKALRAVALEHDWSYYSDVVNVGSVQHGQVAVDLTSRSRLRTRTDDAIRFVDEHGHVMGWAYILPREADHKYQTRKGIWASITRSTIRFSRPLPFRLRGMAIEVPVMREPRMFTIPSNGEEVDAYELEQELDFDYPDLVIARAAFIYAQTDPMMQPRVQTLEAQYKDIMYQLIERDEAHTDTPYQNEWYVPVQNSIRGNETESWSHLHPTSDERWF